MRSNSMNRTGKIFLQAGALILGLASIAGAQTGERQNTAPGTQATTGTAAGFTLFCHDTTLEDTLQAAWFFPGPSPASEAPAATGDGSEKPEEAAGQRLQADIAAVMRWTPERATTDLTNAAAPAFGSSPQQSASASQPATELWKIYQGPPQIQPGAPYPYIWTGGQPTEIFRVTW